MLPSENETNQVEDDFGLPSDAEQLEVTEREVSTDSEAASIPPTAIQPLPEQPSEKPTQETQEVSIPKDEEEEEPAPEPTPKSVWGDVVRVESGGNNNAINPKSGARGRGQVMPYMWERYSQVPFEEATEAEQDRVGLAILNDEYTRFSGNIKLALAAYNAGSPRVIKAIEKAGYKLRDAKDVDFEQIKQFLPDETKDYVPKVLDNTRGKKRSSSEPTNIGTKADAQAAIMAMTDDPLYASESAGDSYRRLKDIYNSKDAWEEDAADVFKNVSSVIWKGAHTDEKPDLGGIIGAAPRIEEGDTDDIKKRKLTQWRTEVDERLGELGVPTALLGKEYDKYFEDAAAAEEAAYEYRNRSALGDIVRWPINTVQAAVGGAVSNYSGALAAVPRLMGAEETADFIESKNDILGMPTRDYFYEVDKDGYIKYDEYGNPLTKIQGTIASGIGQGIGLLTGGVALRAAGIGTKAVTIAMGGTNVLNTANSAYRDAIENGGTPMEGRLAALYSVPSAAIDTLGDMYVVGGGKAWVKGMSRLDQAVFLAKEVAPDVAVEGTTEAIQQGMQDLGTSSAIGKDITSRERIIEAGIAGAAAGGAVSGLKLAIDHLTNASPGANATDQQRKSGVFGRPDPKEQIRLSDELKQFKYDSKDESTVLDFRSLADLDPAMFERYGVTATVIAGNKVKITRKTSTPEDVAQEAAKEEDALRGQINQTAERLAKNPPSTIEHAQETAKELAKENERWRGLSGEAKNYIPFIRRLKAREKTALRELNSYIAEQQKWIRDHDGLPSPTLTEFIERTQRELDLLNYNFKSMPEAVQAMEIADNIRSGYNKLNSITNELNQNNIVRDENVLNNLIKNNLAMAESAIEASEEAEETPAERAKVQQEVQSLLDEAMKLKEEVAGKEKPKNEREIEVYETHVLTSALKAYDTWGDPEIAEQMKTERRRRWNALKSYWQEHPEESKALRAKFDRLEEIKNQYELLRYKHGFPFPKEMAEATGIYGSPERDVNFAEWSRGYQVFDVYHGSPKFKGKGFDKKFRGSNTEAYSAEEAFFGTAEPELAADYAKAYNEGGEIPESVSVKINDLGHEQFLLVPYIDNINSSASVKEEILHLTQKLNEDKEALERGRSRLHSSVIENLEENIKKYTDYINIRRQPDFEQKRVEANKRWRDIDEEIDNLISSSLDSEGVIVKTKLRAKNPKIIDAEGRSYTYFSEGGGFGRALQQYKAEGYDAVVLENFRDPAESYNKPTTVYAWFEPNQTRVPWANFSKANEESADLMASPERVSKQQAKSKQDVRYQGVSYNTRAGTRVVAPIGTGWSVLDENGNPIGSPHKYFYDAAKQVHSEDLNLKPPNPLEDDRYENPEMRPVSRKFSPTEPINHTGKVAVDPRSFVKDAKRILKLIARIKRNRPYSMREGGRESPGVGNMSGYADHRSRYLFIKNSNDPQTIVHETAHVVSDELLDLMNRPEALQEGLMEHAYTFYGDPMLVTKGTRRVLSEGFSNFIEHYMTGQPLHEDVLNFFNNEFRAEFPELHQELVKLKDKFKTYLNMDNVTAYSVFTSGKRLKPETATAVENWIDAGRFFHDIDQVAGTNIEDLNDALKGLGKEKAHEAASGEYVTNWENVQIEGSKTLKQILSNLNKADLDMLGLYMLAKYTVARAKGGQATGFSVKRAIDAIQMMETPVIPNPSDPAPQRNPYKKITDAASDIWHWQEDILDLATARSPLFAQIIKRIRDRNKIVTGEEHGFYMPFEREFTPITDVPGGKYKTTMSGSPFMHFAGSTKRILNPLPLYEERAARLLSAANRNYVLNQVLALANLSANPIVDWVRRLPRKSIPAYKTSVETILQSIGKQVDPEFLNVIDSLDDETKAALVTFYAPEQAPPAAADGFVTVAYKVPGNKLEFYEVAPTVLRAFDTDIPDVTKNPIFDYFFVRPNLMFKMGATTFRMTYQIRNLMFRDFLTGFFRTKSANPIAFAKDVATCLLQEAIDSSGLGKALGLKFDWIDMGKRLGARAATMYHVGRDTEQRIYKSSGNKVISGLTKSLNYLENVLSSGERATRNVVMKYRAKELGITDPNQPLTPEQSIELILAYKRATTNFQKQGRQAKFINMFVPFFTARIAEVSQLEKDWAQRKGRFISFALGYLALGLYQALANKDDKWWQNLEPEERGMNFLTPVGNRIARIPLSSLGGLFNSMGNMIGDAIVRDDLLKPSVAENVFALAKNYAPLNFATIPGFAIGGVPIPVPLDLLGVPLKEAAQQMLNRDAFTNRNIVPRGLEEAPTASQYTSATTEMAKELGRIINYSPAKIDHALRGVFPAGLDMVRYVEVNMGVAPITDQRKGLAGVLASAVTKPGFISSSMDRSSEKFYNLEAKYRVNKDLETPEEGRVRKALGKVKEQLSAINTVLSAEPDEETRKDLYAKKEQILEEALSMERGETTPSVRKIEEQGRAELIRKQRKQERIERLRAQEEASQ